MCLSKFYKKELQTLYTQHTQHTMHMVYSTHCERDMCWISVIFIDFHFAKTK